MANETITLSPTIPVEVLNAYIEPSVSPEIEALNGGEINATWLVTDPGRQKLVVQRLGSMFKRTMVEDMHITTDHLHEEGWEVPCLVPTLQGELYLETPNAEDADQPHIWRATTFIESDGKPAKLGPHSFREFGGILARLHKSLASVDYEPQFRIDHFHETDFYLNKLQRLAPQMPDEETHDFAIRILTAYDNLQPLPPSEQQIIHGDPKTNNMLFRGGEPFTYIDWDTVMKDSIWVDVGDLMRSLAEDSIIKTGKPLGLARLREFTEGYRHESMPEVSSKDFFGWALTAMQRITLELTARYINDVVEQNYWNWDRENFTSRRDYVVNRAQTQWQIYTAYQNL